MKITPTYLSIEQLFTSSNEQFLIPAYQRRYSWQFEQLSEFFDDIDTLNENETHLLGSVVCLTAEHKPGINQLEIVDGQQRITTISILLMALKEKFSKFENKEIEDEIEKLLNCRNVDRKKFNKILLGDLDNPDYVNLINNKNEAIVNLNLSLAYNYFKEWIDDFTLERLTLFYSKLLIKTSVIRLDVSNAKDAYKLFETINNRGLKLSHTDIIKNFLLGHSSTISGDTLYEVRDHWKNLIVNLDGIHIDTFFRQLMVYKLKHKISSNETVNLFKKDYIEKVKEASNLSDYYLFNEDQLEDNDEEALKSTAKKQARTKIKSSEDKVSVLEYANELALISKQYGKIINRKSEDKKINDHLYNLERIRSTPSYIFIIDIFHRNFANKQIIEILKVIETFMLRRHICEKRTAELDDIFANVVGISNSDPVSDLKERLLKDLPKDKEFEEMIAQHNFSRHHPRAKYILEEIEYYKINSKDEYKLNTGHDVHLEHIIPQTIKTKKAKKDFGDWITYLGNDSLDLHPHFVDRLGNYTLLAGELNICASNNPFQSKLDEYEKSNLQLTKDIVTNHQDFKYDDVELRSRKLASLAPKIWKF